ncbi:MAG TPA: type II toxin-antitoxin system VapC family toxin [Terriglobales bacterium]
MRTALDTNVLSALWSGEPLASQAAATLAQAHGQGGLVICAPVYAELLAHPSASQKFVDSFLADTNISIDFALEEPVWRHAATSFAAYAQRRRRSGGGTPKRLLVDFIVAAHALLRADRLMTLDASRYERDFPRLRII